MTVEERIELLKQNILHFTQRLLNFDVVEIRLLDARTRRLEPLLAEGMSPEAAGRRRGSRCGDPPPAAARRRTPGVVDPHLDGPDRPAGAAPAPRPAGRAADLVAPAGSMAVLAAGSAVAVVGGEASRTLSDLIVTAGTPCCSRPRWPSSSGAAATTSAG